MKRFRWWVSRSAPTGQWLDNEAATSYLSGIKVDGPATVPIPEGLGQVINADGSIVPSKLAVMVPSANGIRSAYPVLGP